MKFYEFNEGFEYYALIGVDAECTLPEEVAKRVYEEEVADLKGEEKSSAPDEITKDEALSRCLKANIEGCPKEEQRKDYFEKSIKINPSKEEDSVLLLIDATLC